MKLPAWAVLALGAAGCSLIIPLDYTGGTGGSSGTGGARAGDGGTGGVGNAPQGGSSHGAEAGVGDEGGNPQGGGGPEGGTSGMSPGGTTSGGQGGSMGGTDGGTSGSGGTSGGVSGSSMGGEDAGGEAGTGAAGTSGGGVGGSGGANGGRGGRGGTGGVAGMGGTAGCSFDLTSNPMHCGSCTNACPSGDECIDSKCVSSPCDQLGCTSIQMPINNGDGPRKENLGTGDVCVEVASYTPNSGYLPGISCWNFATGRVTEVNKVAVVCGQGDKHLSMPKRKGGYCFHAGPGESASAGFVMPYAPNPQCCTAGAGGTGGQ